MKKAIRPPAVCKGRTAFSHAVPPSFTAGIRRSSLTWITAMTGQAYLVQPANIRSGTSGVDRRFAPSTGSLGIPDPGRMSPSKLFNDCLSCDYHNTLKSDVNPSFVFWRVEFLVTHFCKGFHLENISLSSFHCLMFGFSDSNIGAGRSIEILIGCRPPALGSWHALLD